MAPLMEKHQLSIIAELRERIADVLPEFKNDFRRNDVSLKKFLIAREFKLDKAEEMVRKTVEWRRANDVNNILEKPFHHEMDPYYNLYIPGFDKEGHPIVLAPVGIWDPLGAVAPNARAMTQILVVQFCEQMYNIFERASADNPTMVPGIFMIFDCGGFDYKHLANTDVVSNILGMLQEFVQMLVNNYPEIMFKIFVVNAPAVFTIAWAVVRPMLTARSLSKIHIFGTRREQWRKKLLQFIDPENLPASYGGLNTTNLINKFEIDVGVVDHPPLQDLPATEFISATIQPGKAFLLDVKAEKGQKIIWNFSTKEHDIRFGVSYEVNKEVIVNSCRVDSHELTQKGTLCVEMTGKYTLKWDNSYSMFTKKELRYATTVKNI